MTTAPICVDCQHYDEGDKAPPTCRAFPDGIPMKFWLAEQEHRQPEPGDHGLQFEPLPEQ